MRETSNWTRRSSLLPAVFTLLALHPQFVRAAEISGGIAGTMTARQSQFTVGRAYYDGGEYKKAAAHFRLALTIDPNDADSYYWMGMAYQVMADLGGPFGGRYRAKARYALSKAVALAPARSDYRHDLFTFLLDSASASDFIQAAGILRSVSESDPEYVWMRAAFEREKRASSTMETRVGWFLLAPPQAVYRVAEAPIAAVRDRNTAGR